MKIIEGMKLIKELQIKAKDLKKRITVLNSALKTPYTTLRFWNTTTKGSL